MFLTWWSWIIEILPCLGRISACVNSPNCNWITLLLWLFNLIGVLISLYKNPMSFGLVNGKLTAKWILFSLVLVIENFTFFSSYCNGKLSILYGDDRLRNLSLIESIDCRTMSWLRRYVNSKSCESSSLSELLTLDMVCLICRYSIKLAIWPYMFLLRVTSIFKSEGDYRSIC